MTQASPTIPMTARPALIALADGMRVYFQQNNVPAVVAPVGWRYRQFNINEGPGGGSRVCLIPGKIDPSSPGVPKVIEAGRFGDPQLQGPGPRMGGPMSGAGNPRHLAAFYKIVSLSIWAVDTSDTSNDELQLAALENLLDWTYQAMHNAVDPVTGQAVGLADVELTDAVWTLPPVDRAFGRELVAYFELHTPIFDAPVGVTTAQPAIIRSPAT